MQHKATGKRQRKRITATTLSVAAISRGRSDYTYLLPFPSNILCSYGGVGAVEQDSLASVQPVRNLPVAKI